MDPFGDDIDDLIGALPEDMRSGIVQLEVSSSGTTTIIQNFASVLKKLQRDEKHVKKFLSKTLGVQTRVKGKQLVLMSSLPKSSIEEAFGKYIDTYVICPNCGKPDTLLEVKNKKTHLNCLACGHAETL